MIKAQREARIVELVEQQGVVSIRELADRLGRVSEVSIRRDLARLAQSGRIRRTRGGAERLAAPPAPLDGEAGTAGQSIVESVDALILPPISGAGASMLRQRARRRGIPFIAESSPQDGGVYLGPDNFAAGYDLGRIAGRQLGETTDRARILLVAHDGLPNTRMRCDGFLQGFGETFAGDVVTWRVDGEGAFRSALRASIDALAANPDINVLFGVNDHSILAALEASDRLSQRDVAAYSVGGEGAALWDMLSRHGRFRATAALFPEVVGARAIDVVAAALAGDGMPEAIPTAHVIITPETLPRYYHRDGDAWALNDDGLALIGPTVAGGTGMPGQRIGFMPHYPAHDWYRNMARAMQLRAARYGLDLVVAAPGADIAREIRARRQEIARMAARQVQPGDTVLIGGGEACRLLARELAAAEGGFTVVTNAFDVLESLADRPAIKVILTSGEYHAAQRCLVGPSLGALFETIRIDTAFIGVDGVSLRFGLSASDERMALAAWRFVQAARTVCVLADHSLVGLDASHRIAPLAAVGELITDSGSLPADRLALASAGVRVVVADEETGETEPPPNRSGGGLPAALNDRLPMGGNLA